MLWHVECKASRRTDVSYRAFAVVQKIQAFWTAKTAMGVYTRARASIIT